MDKGHRPVINACFDQQFISPDDPLLADHSASGLEQVVEGSVFLPCSRMGRPSRPRTHLPRLSWIAADKLSEAIEAFHDPFTDLFAFAAWRLEAPAVRPSLYIATAIDQAVSNTLRLPICAVDAGQFGVDVTFNYFLGKLAPSKGARIVPKAA